MNVDPKNAPGIANEPRGVTAPARSGPARGAGVPASGDRVEISGRAEAFRRALPRLDGLPDAGRQQRITELEALVAQGSYAVTGGAIADAMLRDEATARLLGFDSTR